MGQILRSLPAKGQALAIDFHIAVREMGHVEGRVLEIGDDGSLILEGMDKSGTPSRWRFLVTEWNSPNAVWSVPEFLPLDQLKEIQSAEAYRRRESAQNATRLVAWDLPYTEAITCIEPMEASASSIACPLRTQSPFRNGGALEPLDLSHPSVVLFFSDAAQPLAGELISISPLAIRVQARKISGLLVNGVVWLNPDHVLGYVPAMIQNDTFVLLQPHSLEWFASRIPKEAPKAYDIKLISISRDQNILTLMGADLHDPNRVNQIPNTQLERNLARFLSILNFWHGHD